MAYQWLFLSIVFCGFCIAIDVFCCVFSVAIPYAYQFGIVRVCLPHFCIAVRNTIYGW